MGVRKGADGLLYTKMLNARTGRTEWVNTIKAAKANVAIPGYDEDLDYIPIMRDEGLEYVKKAELDYRIPSGDALFSTFSNLIPFKSSINAGRALMAAKHVTQALSLTNREAPLVCTLGPDGKTSVEEDIGGALGAIRAARPGRAVYVGGDHIRVLYDDGKVDRVELYDSFPYNKKTYLTNKPAVKAGQHFGAGALLASSNYTDNAGVAALGTNVRTAYMPYYGGNYRDAFVISDAAAQKFTSEHLYNIFTPARKNIELSKGVYRALFPGKYSREQWDNLDNNGLVKPGTVVKQGDPLTVAVQRNAPGVGTLGRKTYADRSSE
jgi:DNA-directed RNA polymerase beta subunit